MSGDRKQIRLRYEWIVRVDDSGYLGPLIREIYVLDRCEATPRFSDRCVAEFFAALLEEWGHNARVCRLVVSTYRKAPKVKS